MKERRTNGNWMLDLKFSIAIGVMVFFILGILQPFGIHGTFKNIYRIFLLCIFISVFCFFFNWTIKRIFPSFFSMEKWNIWKTLLIYSLNYLLIAMINFLYSVVFFHQKAVWSSYVYWIYTTFIVGIIPSSAAYFMRRNRILKNRIGEAEKMKAGLARNGTPGGEGAYFLPLSAGIQGNREEKTDMHDIVAVESCGNYIRIYIVGGRACVVKTIRQTMKHMEECMSACPFLVKCHRAYIINLEYIDNIEGNSQGYKLKMRYLKNEVPVSRSYCKILKDKIEN